MRRTAGGSPGRAFAWSWSRASFRRNWPGLLGIILLLGLMGGLSLFATAGARRTQSAYPRFLRSTNPSTMAVDVGGLDRGGREELAAIAQLPEVSQARAYAGFYTAPWSATDGPDQSKPFEAIGSIDGRYFDQDRFTPLAGRAPDPNRADEVAVNEQSARLYGYHVGQLIDFGTVSRADVEGGDGQTASDPGSLQPRLLTHATIVGVGAFIEEVLQDDTDRQPIVLFTPAFVREAAGLELYAWQGLVLRNGDADVPAVEHAVIAGGGAQLFRLTSIDTYHAEQAIRPVSLALAAFGIIAGVGCLVLVGQALARHVRGQREAHDVARSLGAGRAALAFAASLGPAAAVVLGALLAVGIAIAASPAMPIGRMKRVEIEPGVDADWTVLGLGAVVFVGGLLLVLALAARREAPRRAGRRREAASRSRRSHSFDVFALPPAMAVGTRFSLGSSDRSIVRSVVASAAVAVGALVAAVTFGTSMRHLISHPRLSGWDWDVALVDGGGYANTNPTKTQPVLSVNPDIEGWSGAFFGTEQINGTEVPLLGMDPHSAVIPPIRSGRMIQQIGEIVLGTATLARLHVDVGDMVSSSSGSLRVVGSATFPTIGVVHGNHPSLGVGGLVVTEQVPGYDRNIARVAQDAGTSSKPLASEYGPNVLFVRFRDGTDKQAAMARLAADLDKIGDPNGLMITPVQRSAEIVNADSISGASAWLATAIAAAAVASFALALAAVGRRRRRDLALLRALGFTRRQVSAAVSWHATTVVLFGLAIGVPAGLLIGRLTWNLFAHQLDVLAEPAVSVIGVAIIVFGALIAASVFGAFMSRRARTLSVGIALRDE